jgi:nucleoid DNA-binding protein
MSTVTKRDLIVELSNRTGLTQTQTFDFFQKAVDLIAEELGKGNEVTLRRFGTFEVRLSKVKIGRNPNKPGSEIQIPPRAVVKFRPGNELKELVAGATARFQTPAAGAA